MLKQVIKSFLGSISKEIVRVSKTKRKYNRRSWFWFILLLASFVVGIFTNNMLVELVSTLVSLISMILSFHFAVKASCWKGALGALSVSEEMFTGSVVKAKVSEAFEELLKKPDYLKTMMKEMKVSPANLAKKSRITPSAIREIEENYHKGCPCLVEYLEKVIKQMV